MGYNRFYFIVVLRVLLITANALLIGVLLGNRNWLYTLLFFVATLVLQTLFLIRYVNRTNKELATFIIHLKEQSTSQAFSDSNLEHTFRGLSSAFDQVKQEMKQALEQGQQHENLLSVIINQINTAVLAFDQHGRVRIQNPVVWEMLKINRKNSLNTLTESEPDLMRFIKSLKPGEQKLFKSLDRGIQLLVNSLQVKTNRDIFDIYTMHNISREMSAKEMDSWTGLLRVLTHEIMNTLTPVSTLTDTINECVEEQGVLKSEINTKDIEDIQHSARIIDNRIKGLQYFVQRYKQFTQLPPPEPKNMHVKSFVEKLLLSLKLKEVTYTTNIPEDLHLEFDDRLIQLVFTNIIKNAHQAIEAKTDAQIRILANRNSLEISDNGHGIPVDLLDKVLMPFYTTKENGSGIGLSLARQIMLMHHGDLFISSNSQGTKVVLVF